MILIFIHGVIAAETDEIDIAATGNPDQSSLEVGNHDSPHVGATSPGEPAPGNWIKAPALSTQQNPDIVLKFAKRRSGSGIDQPGSV